MDAFTDGVAATPMRSGPSAHSALWCAVLSGPAIQIEIGIAIE